MAVDLKLEEFKPGDMGQMELYLKWLDRYERKEGEEKPIGLILCAGKRASGLNCSTGAQRNPCGFLLDEGFAEEGNGAEAARRGVAGAVGTLAGSQKQNRRNK